MWYIYKKLNVKDFRPTKDGSIIDDKAMKLLQNKKSDCLKSFDGKISGKIDGWIFAKVVIGNGGHQDNVFEEADVFCKWIQEYGDNTSILLCLLIQILLINSIY